MHTGVRNTSWTNSHILSVSYAPLSRLRLSALGGVGLSYLYPLADVQGLPEDEGPDFRYATLTQLSAQVDVVNGCSLRAGVENFYAQLRPDGTHQTFFFNRYANVFLDLVVSSLCLPPRRKIEIDQEKRYFLYLALPVVGCTEERPPIDRVQPFALEKSFSSVRALRTPLMIQNSGRRLPSSMWGMAPRWTFTSTTPNLCRGLNGKSPKTYSSVALPMNALMTVTAKD